MTPSGFIPGELVFDPSVQPSPPPELGPKAHTEAFVRPTVEVKLLALKGGACGTHAGQIEKLKQKED